MQKTHELAPRNTKTSALPPMQKLWVASLFLYIVCMIAFTGTPDTVTFNSISLYFFLGVSIFNILLSGKIRFNFFGILLILYGVWLLFTWLYSPSQSIAVEYINKYWKLVIICFCVINCVDSVKKINIILNAYVLGGLCLSIYGFSFYGLSVFDAVTESRFIIRIGSEVGNANSVGMICAMSAVISLFFLIYKHFSRSKQYYYILITVICSVFALLTGSKKALILLLTGVVLLLLLKREARKYWFSKAKIIIIGGIVVFLLIYAIHNVPIFRTIDSRMTDMINLFLSGDGNQSDQTRLYYTKRGLEVFGENPLLGAGAFASYKYFGTYSHNNYVEILMNTGIVGFILFYFSYPIFFFKLKSKSNEPFKIFAVIFIVIHLILGFGFIYYYNRYTQIMFAVIACYLSRLNVYNE